MKKTTKAATTQRQMTMKDLLDVLEKLLPRRNYQASSRKYEAVKSDLIALFEREGFDVNVDDIVEGLAEGYGVDILMEE